jgi:hypothetical protein
MCLDSGMFETDREQNLEKLKKVFAKVSDSDGGLIDSAEFLLMVTPP